MNKTSLFKYLIVSIIIIGSLIIPISDVIACGTVTLTAKPQCFLADKNVTSKITAKVIGPDGKPATGTITFTVNSPSSSDRFSNKGTANISNGIANITFYHYRSNPGIISISAIATITVQAQDGTLQTLNPTGYIELFAVKIIIKQNDNDITDTTHDEIVGKRIYLTAEVQPLDIPVTRREWTIPGKKVADYICSLSSATVVEFTNTKNISTDFCWVNGAEGRVVKHSVVAPDGSKFEGKATFNVKKPTSTMTTSTGTVAADSNFNLPGIWLHYGDGGYHPGILFTQSTTNPPGISGETAYWQVVITSNSSRKADGIWDNIYLSNLLDTRGLAIAYSNNPVTSDSPGLRLDNGNCTEAKVSDEFRMWLMFKPDEPDSIWVPLRSVAWSWSGKAKKKNSKWQLTGAHNTVNPRSSDTTNFPIWFGNSSQY